VFLASSAANAEELSAGQLYAMCTSKDEVATTACRFFIFGVVQGIRYGDGSVMGPDSHLSPHPPDDALNCGARTTIQLT